jgi:hypothetical protein
VVITAIDATTGRERVTLFHFDSPDLMWINVGGPGTVMPDSPMREYFTRLDAGASE